MLPSSHPRVATNALQLLSNAVARTPSVGVTVARGGSPRPASPSIALRKPLREYSAMGCEGAGARPVGAGQADASREERVLVVAVQRVVESSR